LYWSFVVTLHVEFLAGPGTGKSTTNALVFGSLKKRGRNAELSPEYAKELAWKGILGTELVDQVEIAAEQRHRHRALEGKVEVTLSDTSILLGLIYGNLASGMTPKFRNWLVDEHRRMNTLTIFLERNPDRAYNAAGRGQSKEEAEALDLEIKTLLDDYHVPYTPIYVDKDDSYHVGKIVQLIEDRLDADVPYTSVNSPFGI
jgi:hypothetical protein